MSAPASASASATPAEQLLALCRDALAVAGEAEVEMYARTRVRGIARFAVGELGQHMELEEPLVTVRVANGKRVAQAMTTRLERASIVSAVQDAARAARVVPEVEGFPGFAAEGEPTPTAERWSERTAATTAEERAARVAHVIERVHHAGLVAAGVLDTTRCHYAVTTTRGCARSHDATTAAFKVWALETPGAGGAAGYGGHVHRDFGALAIDAQTERAVRLASLGKRPTSVAPGSWDVVMEPAAVSELLEWLGTIAFGASEVEQGTSPMAGRSGALVTGENVSITEDPLDASELGFGVPFDREGTPRRRVALVERGVAREVLYDRTYAKRAGGRARSTGSAVLGDLAATGSVAASALHLAGGDAADVDELLAGMDRGLYVCRLHYVNGLLEPRRAVMTGLTRDGCFLVEKGRITSAVHNMRFTDSFLEGLARSDAMTRACAAIPTWWSDLGACVAPAVRMRAFRFNGTSEIVA